MELEKQEKRVARSKKKQSKLRREMKQAQEILAQKEALVREKQKIALLYGLSSRQQRAQYRKNRHHDSPGYQRKSEADISKAKNVINMLSRVVKMRLCF